jgi:hypothetical protein
MNLYLIHCGFYDQEMSDGIYESHVNFFVIADSFEAARVMAREIPEFKAKKMHVDGIQEIRAVNGHKVRLEKDLSLGNQTIVVSHKHRDLAKPTKPADSAQGLNTV